MRPANTGNYYLGWPVSVSTSPIREFHSPLSVPRIADLELNCCRHYASTRQCRIQVRCTTLQRVSRFSARACTSRLCTATNFSFRAEIIRGCREWGKIIKLAGRFPALARPRGIKGQHVQRRVAQVDSRGSNLSWIYCIAARAISAIVAKRVKNSNLCLLKEQKSKRERERERERGGRTDLSQHGTSGRFCQSFFFFPS